MPTWVSALLVLVWLGACSPGDGPSMEEPTAGVVWANAQYGYGEVAPSEIYNGGVPTGHVLDIEWESWGGDTAIGNGTGYYSPTGASASSAEEPAVVVAFDLGDCDGQLAYRKVRWFFLQQGELIDLDDGYDDYDICDRYEVPTP